MISRLCRYIWYLKYTQKLYVLFESIFYLIACLFLKGIATGTHKRKLRDTYVKIFLSEQLKAGGAGVAAWNGTFAALAALANILEEEPKITQMLSGEIEREGDKEREREREFERGSKAKKIKGKRWGKHIANITLIGAGNQSGHRVSGTLSTFLRMHEKKKKKRKLSEKKI